VNDAVPMPSPAPATTTAPTPRLIARLGRAQIEQTTRGLAHLIGARRPSQATLDTIPVPDTASASAAEALIAESVPLTLVRHSHRTYAFGALLGARDGLDWDAELLYVAAMLHDLSLGDSARRDEPFERVGAQMARGFALERGWPEERAELVGRAIALHMEVGRATRERPEVALLHLGAAADVIGARLQDISPDTVAEVVERHPREGFKAFFADAMRDEARRNRRSTAARLCRWGQFTWRIKRAPFEE
jgi:HD domain-containing protein